MDDSEEFDPIFAVPASIDDSQGMKQCTDDPLGNVSFVFVYKYCVRAEC